MGLNVPALVIIILCYVWFGLNEVAAIVAVSLNKIPMVALFPSTPMHKKIPMEMKH